VKDFIERHPVPTYFALDAREAEPSRCRSRQHYAIFPSAERLADELRPLKAPRQFHRLVGTRRTLNCARTCLQRGSLSPKRFSMGGRTPVRLEG
jgi:hypothetical protein